MQTKAWWFLGLTLVGCEEVPNPFGGPTGILANNDQAQVFDGVVSGFTMPQGIKPNDVILGFESDSFELAFEVYTRPPISQDSGGDVIAAPDVETGFVERWAFRSPSTNDVLTEVGFLMHHEGAHSATCGEIIKSLDTLAQTEGWEDVPGYAEQVLDYVEPGEPDAPLEMATDGALFEVFQPNDMGDIQLEGWMFRMLPPNPRQPIFQDHWLLTEGYDPLGNGGEFAIVLPAGIASASDLNDWFASNGPMAATYASTTYPMETFPSGCVGP
ncbi:MAG: hypothetical protein AAGA48_40220 [Myxococcota bacterium]